MLGELITRSLMMVLGYIYPAFECFKTMEKNRVEIDQLRFWCQYWVIVALVTASERVGDIFISWLPMYGEMKLAFMIYLWFPRTRGTSYVYETFLRPFMTKYEPDLDQNMGELRARAWDLAVMHWKNCAQFGETTFVQFLQYLTSKAKGNEIPKIDPQYPSAPPLNTISSGDWQTKHPSNRRSPSTSPPPKRRSWFPTLGSLYKSDSTTFQQATKTAMPSPKKKK